MLFIFVICNLIVLITKIFPRLPNLQAYFYLNLFGLLEYL